MVVNGVDVSDICILRQLLDILMRWFYLAVWLICASM